MSLEINEKNYYYKIKKVLLIDKVFENELEYHYTFLCYDNEDKNENFVLSKLIELENKKM